MATYATQGELEAYVGDGYTVPEDASRLLARASELIDSKTFGYVAEWWADPLPDPVTTQQSALTRATCAQVEFWLEAGEEVDINRPRPGVMGMRFGDLQVGDLPDELAPRAARVLRLAGLLDRRVGTVYA